MAIRIHYGPLELFEDLADSGDRQDWLQVMKIIVGGKNE